MSLRTALSLCLLTLGGCVSFPAQPPLIGYDPAPNGDSFRVAAAEAVIRDALGGGFYEIFGDRAYAIGSTGPCSEDGLNALLKQEQGCSLLKPGDGPDCREQDLCLRFSMDSRLAENPKVWRSVEAALLNPCQALTPPNDLSYGRWPSVIGAPARSSWKILRCDRRDHVVGSNLERTQDGAVTRIKLTFGLARGEAL